MYKKLLQLKTLLVALLVMTGAGNVWAEKKTEGFETASAGTDYQSTIKVNPQKSDCGIGWEIYYGTVSTSSKISGDNSAALRLYNNKNNYGYIKTTTAIPGLTSVSFKAKAATSNGASIKVNISYSPDGESWTNIETDKGIESSAKTYSVNIPTGGQYFQIAISSSSTKPTKSNVQLTIDDVEFTYTPFSLENSDLALTSASVALSFDLYNNATPQVVNYTTSSTGAVSIADSEYATFDVDATNKTITVTPVKRTKSAQTITVSQAADETYAAGSVTFTLDVADSTPSGENWEATTLADLTADDVFVIVGNNGDNYALANDNGTGSAPSAVSVTVVDGKITSVVPDRIKWTVSGVATNGYTFYPAGSTDTWLYCTNTNNGVRVGTNDNKTFTVSKEGYLNHSGTNRYLGVYNSQDWRCYTEPTANNIKNQTFTFYRYVDPTVPQKADPELAWSASSASAIVGEAFTAPTLTNPNNLTVTYSSMDASVATVNESTGAVTIKGVGTTIITANFAGNDTYKPGTASYTLVVSPSTPVGVVVWKEDWSGFGTDNNTPAVSGNASYVYTNGNSDTKLYGDNYAGGSKPELLINRNGGAFAATIPLFGAYGNMTLSLKANKLISVKAKVDDEDNVTLTNSGDDTSQIYTINNVPAGATQIVITLTNNSTDSNVRVDDFLLMAPQVGVSIGAAGYSTMYYGSSNLVVPADVVVRTYKVNNGELEASIEYTEGDVLAKAQGYVIKGTAGTYTFTATKNDASVDANNQLRGSDVAVTTTGGTYYYGLSLNAASEPQSVGFYWMEDEGAAFTNGAHKAYLALNNQFASGSAVRGFLLNGTNTGVETLPHESMRSGIVYDLQGRRVNNPGSGLYIINGQKVFNK